MVNGAAAASVSVLLPTFNRARFISQAIESILAQSHRPLEIIVLDDGSTDETADVCAKFGSRTNYVRMPANRGKTAAINHGVMLARGEFVWIMDDDDIAPPQALATLLSPMLVDPEVGFSFGALRKFRETDDGALAFEDEQVRDKSAPLSLFVRLMEDCFITGQPCVLFRRECLVRHAPFDTGILASVDYNILLQVARRSRGVDVRNVVLWQRQHDGNRGPAAVQYASSARVSRWREYDKRLISGLLDELELGEYLGLSQPAAMLSPIQRRKALFQKAVIAGRKELWDDAATSLRAGAAMCPAEPLSPEGAAILSRMFGSRYGIDVFLKDRRLQAQLAEACGAGELGRGMRMAMASLLTFWLRHLSYRGKFRSALSSLRAMIRIAGRDGAAALLWRALDRNFYRAGLGGRSAQAVQAAPSSRALDQG